MVHACRRAPVAYSAKSRRGPAEYAHSARAFVSPCSKADMSHAFWLFRPCPTPPKPPPAIRQDGLCGIVTRRAGHSATRMRAPAAMVAALERPPIIRIAQHRPRPEQLIERERAAKDVAADEAELRLQIERARRPACEHAR